VSADPKHAAEGGALDLLMHVPLRVTAELGSRQMPVSELLKLGMGSVVELDRLATDPVDVLVGEKLIARGEIVAVDENFGVRIVELIGRRR
jgi:flagellar motor switch protein FliN/FliY